MISNTQQKIDTEKYDKNFDSIFLTKKEKSDSVTKSDINHKSVTKGNVNG
jgi:hypothetical protein